MFFVGRPPQLLQEKACCNTITRTIDCTSPELSSNHEDSHRTCSDTGKQTHEQNRGNSCLPGCIVAYLRPETTHGNHCQYLRSMDEIVLLRYIRCGQSLHDRGAQLNAISLTPSQHHGGSQVPWCACQHRASMGDSGIDSGLSPRYTGRPTIHPRGASSVSDGSRAGAQHLAPDWDLATEPHGDCAALVHYRMRHIATGAACDCSALGLNPALQ